MNFAEKLTALFTLTAAKNAELADALGMGRPYISRLKTGERRMPTNAQTIRRIAAFFAERCGDDYRRTALREFTSDSRVNVFTGETILADILFDWLTETPVRPESTSAGHFLSSFALFSQSSVPAAGQDGGTLPADHGIAVYCQNKGKRQALRDMVTFADALDTPHTILLFTDESYDWLLEDDAFGRWLNVRLSQQSSRGMTFERIQPPFNSVEFTFSAIERWLPGYMNGAIQQYHYPWARDELHRRTLFVIPGQIALFSNSVYGDRESPVTMLSRDPEIVDIFNREYYAIRQHCRPAMSTFTANSERLFTESESVAAIPDTGVYKTNRLSVNTLPSEITARIRSLGTPFALRLCESFERRGRSRINVLREHAITDIMCLPKLENILAGREPVPGTQAMPSGMLYYTPEEYRAHLERILWYLNEFPNYQAVFTDDPVNDNVVMYVKGDSRALLVKASEPFAVFDVTERMLATAFCDYLQRIAAEKMQPGARRATMEQLRKELQHLAAAAPKET